LKPGPPKTPTNIIKLRNNPGKRPINENEPEYAGDPIPTAQVLADKDALKLWNDKTPELIEKGVLTFQDSIAFSTYCLLAATWVRLWDHIQRIGEQRAIGKGLIKAWLAVDVRCDRWGAKFGLTPSDRAGIKATPKDRPQGIKEFLT